MDKWIVLWELLEHPIIPRTLPLIAEQHLSEEILGTIVKNFNSILSHSPLDDNQIFSDFLFCLSSYFTRTAAQDRAVLDKRYGNQLISPLAADVVISEYINFVIGLLVENLVFRLTDTKPLDVSIANKIAIAVSQSTNQQFFFVVQ